MMTRRNLLQRASWAVAEQLFPATFAGQPTPLPRS